MGDPKKTHVLVTEREARAIRDSDAETCDQCGVLMHPLEVVYPPDHENSGVVVCGDTCLAAYQSGAPAETYREEVSP